MPPPGPAVRSVAPVSRHLYVLELDGMPQSALDLDDPTHLEFDYVRRIGDLLDLLPAGRLPERRLAVLHVGGAAMTLPRYVHATRPGSAQIVLEPDATLVARVRTEAPLPSRSGIKVRTVDGAAGIAAVRDDSQDVVILDAFDGAHVPHDLIGASFLQQVGRVLAPGGLLVANLRDRSPFPLVRDFVAAARTLDGRGLGEVVVGLEPSTAKAKREGNVLVAAGTLPPQPFGSPPPSQYRVLLGAAVRDSFGGGSVRA